LRFVHQSCRTLLVAGPILIDREQLEKLDDILENEFKRFEEERDRALDTAVENAFKEERAHFRNKDKSPETIRAKTKDELTVYGKFLSRRACIITLDNGKSVPTENFASAFRDADLQDKKPTGFSVFIESGGRKCSVKVDPYRNCLAVEVSPQGDELTQQALTVLKNWQKSVQPPAWLELWSKRIPFFWAIWFMVWMSAVLFTTTLFEQTSRNAFREEVTHLLQNGLTPEKHGRALELLLSISVNYRTNPVGVSFPNWFGLFFWGGLIYCIALSFKPEVAIAIGAGDIQVRRWRQYTRFMLITTPTFICGTFLWPKIAAYIQGLF